MRTLVPFAVSIRCSVVVEIEPFMRTLVPFAATNPKTRLSSVLSAAERREFARLMLASVLDSVVAAGGAPTVLSTDPLAFDEPPFAGHEPPFSPETRAATTVVVDDGPLSVAVNRRLRQAADADPPRATRILMADLPLVTAADITRITDAAGDVVIAPGMGGGTNALVIRDPEFRVDYHGASSLDHARRAADLGATLTAVDSRRLATDIDEPGDLAEVLIHGEGAVRDWLIDAGFELDTDAGRVGVSRCGE